MTRPSNYGRTYITFDWAMKRLLRNKANFVILEGFLSELLHSDIKVQNLLESEGNAETEDDKINRLDLLCENQQQELVIIEIQFNHDFDFFQRMLYGTAKLITEYLDKGAPYKEIRKVYSINIVYFNLGQGTDYVYHGFMQFTGLYQGDVLQLSAAQQVQFNRRRAGDIYPECFILKINNFGEVARNTLDEWIYYFKTSELPTAYRARGLAEVEQQLKVDAMTPDLKAKYMKRLNTTRLTESEFSAAFLEGEYEGLEKGKMQGSAEEKEKTILNGFRASYSIAALATLTELSEAKVLEILKKHALMPDN